MRLLNVKTFEHTTFRDKKPKYVIASHRWTEHEATIKDVRKKRNTESIGFEKVEGFARYVRDHVPTVDWLWIDSCCINQEDAAELSEAVNLMFEWYRDAEICVAYLADVPAPEDKVSFEKSEWFQRGWTLQELLASRTVIFVTKEWQVIGRKGDYVSACNASTTSLEGHISRITGVPEQVLHNYETSLGLSVDERLQWMDGRRTTREEDMSYALYGIFGVTPGANYGERFDGARRRLLGAIRRRESLAAQQAKQFRKLASWISAPDPWTNHRLARQRHEPHTGAWLLHSAEYQSWKSGIIRHLWVHGKAGSGKTILCSTAVEDIRTFCESATAINAGHAVFYFSFSDNQKQLYENLLSSLVLQLSWKEPGLSMLQQAYDKPNRSLPSTDELVNIVLSCIESYDMMFLLLDALDECPESDEVRQNVLESLERLSWNAPKLRLLATSRKVADIDASMEILGAVQVSTETRSVDTDIRMYVSSQLSCDRKLRRMDTATKTVIEETISRNADGMFRWAYCQLQELKTLPSTKPKYVKETLRSLPTTLDATYERMLVNIKQMFRQEALALLHWLAYAERPPSLGELAEATIIDPTEEGSVDIDERGGLEDTLDILSGLVVIQQANIGDDGDDTRSDDLASELSDSDEDEVSIVRGSLRVRKDTKVRLAHFSVKEYLESKRILQSEAREFHLESATGHRFLAQSCLTYLHFYSSSSEKLSTKRDLVVFPLLQYAAESWAYHASLQQVGEVARELNLLTSNNILRDWLLIRQPDRWWRTPFGPLMDTGAGLYYATYVGLEAVVSKLLRSRVDVNVQGGEYGNALQAAVVQANEEIVGMLLDAGADVNARGSDNSTALWAAAADGYEKIVQILLDADADVNARGSDDSTALQVAATHGYEKIVQILLGAGADVNARGSDNSTALQAAAANGYEKIVQMLLDAGADVNARGMDYSTALQTAAIHGYEKIVQILLDAGADVNARGMDYSTALQTAAIHGYEKIVQMLLDAGADVNARGKDSITALQIAAIHGYEKIVQMLLDAGADVDARGEDYIIVLQTATIQGNEKIVQMLLDAGADVDARGRDYSTALHAAARYSYEKIVQRLLNAGAHVSDWGGGL